MTSSYHTPPTASEVLDIYWKLWQAARARDWLMYPVHAETVARKSN